MKKNSKDPRRGLIEQAAHTGFFRLHETLYGSGAVASPSKIAKVVNVMCNRGMPPFLFDVYSIKRVDPAEVSSMAENGLLGLTREKSQEILYRGLNLLNVGRILFVKVLRDKFQMPAEKIREVIEYEIREVTKLVQKTEPHFAGRSLLGIFTKGANHTILLHKDLLAQVKEGIQHEKAKLEHDIQELEEWLGYVKGKKLRELKPEERYFLAEKDLNFIESRLLSQLWWVWAYQDWILQGYSPQVEFRDFEPGTGNHILSFGPIDWEESLLAVAKEPGLSYFRTPDFEISLGGEEITLRIFSPRKVNSILMRRIEKVYNIFRKRLGPQRAPYGDKTQHKEKKERLYKFVQDQFRKMRKETELKVLDIFAEIRKKGVSLSDDSFKRIVYGKKKKG